MTMKVRIETIRLHRSVVKSIKAHAAEQSRKGGYEAVGFVAKREGKNLGVATLPMHNHAPNPTQAFFVEPWEQYRAERKLSEGGYEILGIYHSHVNGEALPSMMDHKMCWEGGCVLIYSVVFDDLKAYRETEGTLEPVEIGE